MENTPLVTVLIPTYNCAAYIRTAIESALAQTYPAVEIIVIDDGSTDDTQTLLQHYKNKIHIITQPNKGAAAARNAGLAIAQGEYIATLDADDSWLPERLEKMVTFLQHNSCDAVFTNFYLVNEQRQPLRLGFNSNPSIPATKQYRSLLINPLPFVMMMTKTALFRQAGGYDEATYLQIEDYDLWLRLLRNGVIWDYIHEPLAEYMLRSTGITLSYSTKRKASLYHLFRKQQLGYLKTLLLVHYHLSYYRWYLVNIAVETRNIKKIFLHTLIALQSILFLPIAIKIYLSKKISMLFTSQ